MKQGSVETGIKLESQPKRVSELSARNPDRKRRGKQDLDR
jgi:hypothetical protein